MALPLFPEIRYQPLTPWGESVKSTLRRSMGIISESKRQFDVEWTSEELRMNLKPFCIAKDPHIGKLCMYTSPNSTIGRKKSNAIGLTYDPDLLCVAEIRDDLRPIALAKYKPMLDAIHLDGYRPEVPSALDMAATSYAPTVDAAKGVGAELVATGIPSGALIYLSGWITYAPLSTATLLAGTAIGSLGLLSATKSILPPILRGIFQQKPMQEPVKPDAINVYTFEGTVPELAI